MLTSLLFVPLLLTQTGVFGQNQDEVTLQHTAVLGPYTGLICEDLSLVIDCPSGYFTNFLSASYGRYDNQDTCMEDGEIVTLTDGCLDDTSVLESLRSVCTVDQEDCTILVNRELLGDPCPGHANYLNVSYNCQQQVFRGLACEGSSVTLTCFGNDVITVQDVLYGRDNNRTCSHETAILTTQCAHEEAPGWVRDLCTGRSSCTVSVDANAFGDPCEGTFKYMEINFTCSACTNQHGDDADCSQWRDEGFCESNAEWMFAYCRKACTRCDVTGESVCSCGTLKRKCHLDEICITSCTKNCQNDNFQCNTCNNVVADASCEGWAEANECVLNPDWMPVNCARACNLCSQYQPSTTTAAPTTAAPATTSWAPPTFPDDHELVTTCADSDMLLQCSDGYIRVLDAYYGRTTNAICPQADGTALPLCNTTGSVLPFLLASLLCNGRSSCYLYVDDPPFTDPCPEAKNFLEVRYQCQPCENTANSTDCGVWQTWNECNANRYWMLDNCFETCSYCQTNEDCSNVQADASCDYWTSWGECLNNAEYMSTNCQRSCRLCSGTPPPTFTPRPTTTPVVATTTEPTTPESTTTAEPTSTTEPTPVTIPPTPAGAIRSETCRQFESHLMCTDPGTHIRVLNVFFGRHNLSICPDDLASTTACQANVTVATAKAREVCNGRQTCYLRPLSPPFEDTCPDSSKYLIIDYVCEPCQDSDERCTAWAADDECMINPIWMSENCFRACSGCDSTVACNNSLVSAVADSSCDYWMSYGECVNNTEWMMGHCEKSCRLCTDLGLATTTTPTPESTTTAMPADGLYHGSTCGTLLNLTCPEGQYLQVQSVYYGIMNDTRCPGSGSGDATCRTGSTDGALGIAKSLCDGRYYCNFPSASPPLDTVCAGLSPYTDIDFKCAACENVDSDSSCDSWAEAGYCESNADYMRENCFRSCYQCEVTETCSNDENDITCDFWTTLNQCNENPDYMHLFCRRSCRSCDQMTTTTEATTTTATTTTATTTTMSTTTTPPPTTTPPTTTTPQPDCFDANTNNQCPGWASVGECDSNPLWMHRFCQFSCGCIGAGGTSTACEGSSARMHCSPGYEVVVLDAMFGRQDEDICPHDWALTNVTCRSEDATDIVSNWCAGRSTCYVSVFAWMLGDPCPGVYKYLAVNYTCQRMEHRALMVCEGAATKLECAADTQINITQAFYGRQDNVTCPHRTAMIDMGCASDTVLDDVSSMCNAHSACQFDIMVRVLGDPCPGTYKYAQLQYDCVRLCGDPGCEHGVCVGVLNCLCDPGYTGSSCSQVTCSEIDNCSGHGTCSGPNTCTCDSGYEGHNCATPSCEGVMNCNGHGTCVSPNVCTCNSGYSGTSCALFSCSMMQDCSGHGSCVGPEQCECQSGYAGPACTDVSCTAVSNCSNHGTCVGPNTCVCEAGYAGAICDQLSCANVLDCMNQGECVGPNVCQCHSGYFGQTCAEHSCLDVANCNGHGTCSGPNTCSCYPGYSGPACDQYNCLGVQQCHGQGTCVAPDTCSCHDGYMGMSCDQITCIGVNDCTRRGQCIGPNTCSCEHGYTGPSCSEYSCSAISNCHGQGSCTGPNVCTCNRGYYGSMCESFTCSGVSNCSGHGRCIGGDQCECDEGWTGEDCSLFGDGQRCSGLNSCNGRGICVANNTCWCFPYYSGIDCSQCSINGIGQACVTCPPCQNGYCVQGTDSTETDTFMGCYLDVSNSRDLPIVIWTGSQSAAVRMCIEACYLRGYKYAGLQGGDSCYCGNTYGRHGTTGGCNLPCTNGQMGEMCGGIMANSIYMTYQGMCECDGPNWTGAMCDQCSSGYVGSDCTPIPTTTMPTTTTTTASTVTYRTTSSTSTASMPSSAPTTGREAPRPSTTTVSTTTTESSVHDQNTYEYMNLEALVGVPWRSDYEDMGNHITTALMEDIKATLEQMYRAEHASFTYITMTKISPDPMRVLYYLNLSPAISEEQAVALACTLTETETTGGIQISQTPEMAHVCSQRNSYCEHGGTLLRRADGQFYCRCTPQYSGWRCSHSALDRYLVIIVIVLATAVSAIIVLIVCCCLKGVCNQKPKPKVKKTQTHLLMPNNGTARSFQYHGMAKGMRGTKLVSDQERGISREHADNDGYVPRQI